MVGVVPQNLILIPVYLAMTGAAMYYLFVWEEEVFETTYRKERKTQKKNRILDIVNGVCGVDMFGKLY